MDEVLLRFPHLGEKTFKMLSNKNLIKCKIVNKTWYQFIINQKFYNQKVFYENQQKNVDDDLETFLHKAAENGQLAECKVIIDNVENKSPADND